MTNDEFENLKTSVIDATVFFLRDCADIANKQVSGEIETTASNHLRDSVLDSWSVNTPENIAILQEFKIKLDDASQKIRSGDFLGMMSVPAEFADTIDDALFQTYRNSNNTVFDQTTDVLNTAYNGYDYAESLPLDPKKFIDDDGVVKYVGDVLSTSEISKLSFWAGGLAGIAEAGVAGYEAGTDAAIAKALETVAVAVTGVVVTGLVGLALPAAAAVVVGSVIVGGALSFFSGDISNHWFGVNGLEDWVGDVLDAWFREPSYVSELSETELLFYEAFEDYFSDDHLQNVIQGISKSIFANMSFGNPESSEGQSNLVVADASGVTDTSGHDHYGGKEGAFLRFNDSNEGITVNEKGIVVRENSQDVDRFSNIQKLQATDFNDDITLWRQYSTTSILDYEGSAGNGEPEITMNDLGFELLAGAGFDTVLGSQNNDRIYLGQDGGVANGRTGKDNFFIEHGLNKIDGGFDDDTVTFDLSSGLTISKIENTTINLYDDSPQSSGTVFTSASASGVIAGVEKIIGTNFDDFVTMERSGYQASDVNEFDMRDGIDHFHVDFYNDVGR